MIEEAVHLLQRISCIWFALSVIYPVVNNKITVAAQRNNPVVYDCMLKSATQSEDIFYPACATLVLTIADILISIL